MHDDTYHTQHFGLIWTESATTRQRLSQCCERARLLLCVYVLRVSSRELAGAESPDPGARDEKAPRISRAQMRRRSNFETFCMTKRIFTN